MTEERGTHLAFPSLFGAPAYARPPKPVAAVPRPIDPDDLPLERERTAEERALAALIGASSDNPAGSSFATADGRRNGNGNGGYRPGPRSAGDERGGAAARRFSLRALAELFRDPGRYAGPGR